MLGHSLVSESHDLIVVGGGIVGAACAWECARGGLRVLLLEAGSIGAGTTAAGMGHLVVMDDSQAQFQLTHYSRTLWQELATELPDGAEFDPCGTLWIAADEEEMQEVLRKADYYRTRGVEVEVLNAADVRALEPGLRPDLAGALRVPGDSVIYPPVAARWLCERARAAGAEVQTGVAVRGLLEEGGVELMDGSRIPSVVSVNAAGCHAPVLTPGLPIRKRKGHLVITDRYPGFVRHQVIELGYLKSAHAVTEDSVAFNIQPRKTGQMLIGSSRQFDAEDSVVESRLLDAMLRRALHYLPGLGSLNVVRAWTGHRAATQDKLPLIGPTPGNAAIWLATGHEGLGITTSLGTARILADRLLGREPSIPFKPYDPARVSLGALAHA